MKNTYFYTLVLFVLSTLAVQAAAPVGDTIWLYHDANGSYVSANSVEGYRLEALGTSSVGEAEKFIVEDAGGGNILLKSVVNGNYVRVVTTIVDKLYADTTDTVDILNHYIWTDLPGGKVRLTSVGDTDGTAYVSPAGVAQVLRSNISTIDSLSEFTWGLIGSPGIAVPDVVDSRQSVAQTAIENAGLVLGTVTDAYSATIAISNVVSQNPAAGANVASNTAVNLAISIGPGSTTSTLIQHLVAAATNVVGNPVAQWTNRSGAGNDAVEAEGNVTYPSASVSGSGLAGLDFGTGANSLELFSAAESDAWLDFTGAASANSGFAVLMAFRLDQFNSTISDLLGNSSAVGNGFAMRMDTDGTLKAWVTGSSAQKAVGKVSLRETVVLALNYNASTGNLEFWDSNSGTASSWTATATDFSAESSVTVGKTTGSDRYFIGMVGEIKVFDRVLDVTELGDETSAMIDDWVTVTSIKVPEEITAVSDIGEVQLDWLDDISGDLFACYSLYRSTNSESGYVEIATNLIESTYLDLTAEAGVPYYYVVTAMDTNGTESAYSDDIGGSPQVLSVLQHLDATDESSILVSGTVVTQWVDQSSLSNDAVAFTGSVLYPSTLTSASGLTGLNMRSGLNALQLFPAGGSSWLDQSSSTNGFCVMVAFTCDDLVLGVDNDLIGNSSDGSSGFGMRYTAAGEIQAFLGGEQIVSTGHPVEAGDTLVFALNYNAAERTYDFWDSKNYTLVSGTLPKTDFSTASPVTLGSAASASRYINGMVGEVVVYDESLSSVHFKTKRDQLAQKWINRPNIVMIYVDDWAWNGSSVTMDERMPNSEFPDIMEMPNLDLMASNGMVFRNAYGSPQCAAARAALQTGQSNARNGFTVTMNGGASYYYDKSSEPGGSYEFFPVVPNGADDQLKEDAVSIAEALAPMGYQSALFGKWHLNDDPNNEGFYAPDGATDNNQGNTTSSTLLDSLVDPKMMTHVTDSGIAFMEKQVAAGNPFYVQFSHYAMHEGRECFPSSRARFQNHPAIVTYNDGETNPANINRKNDPAVWLGMAYELDQKIGEVRQKLVDLGVDDNTYVIVVGDNGYREDFFDDIYGLSQPLHAHKWWVWQAGIRVPMVVEGPGVVSNSRTTANVVNYDFLPTFVDWAGGDFAKLQDLDGISLAGLMNGEPQSSEFLNRSLYFHYPHYRTTMPHSSLVKGTHKLVYFYETPVRFPGWEPIMLFDLAHDAGEYQNIYSENPALGDALYADMTNYFAAVGARIPLAPNPKYDQGIYEVTNTNYFNANFDDPADEMKGRLKDYEYRTLRGPFVGTRTPEEDETGPVTFMDYWMDSFDVDLGTETNDYDGDGIVNWAEYSNGSDPTDGSSAGALPVLENDGGTLTFQYMKRNDDSGLEYIVETTTNLMSGVWTNATGSAELTETAGVLDEVSRTLPVDEPNSYYRLKTKKK